MNLPSPPLPVSVPLVVQHNALINARFLFGPLETRLFLHLLGRVRRDDTHFSLCRVEVSELIGESSSQNTYKVVRDAVEKFATRTLTIEQLSTNGRKGRQPDFVVLPLLSIAQYRGGEGAVEARFNDAVMPYLLELRDNFTKAQLTELLKLKNPYSHRIYWLLREYAAFGQRLLSLAELKAMLKLGPGYDRWDNFRTRILDRAQEELAATDLPFTYEALKQGRHVTDIKFMFAPVKAQLPAQVVIEDGWEALLLASGISPKSMAKIRTQLDAGFYDEGYIRYVVATIRSQVAAGKVKKEGGAVFKALTDGYLLADYQKPKPTTSKGRATASSNRQQAKLKSEIDDLQISLRWILNEAPDALYPGEKRGEAAMQIEHKITALTAQLTA
jgi:Initiator Replication protein